MAPRLSQENGILFSTFAQNEREISRHESKQTHQILLRKMMKDYQSAQDLTPAITYHEDPKLIVTNRVLRTVYLCVENGVALTNMKDMVGLQRTHGEHFKTYRAMVISTTFSFFLHRA